MWSSHRVNFKMQKICDTDQTSISVSAGVIIWDRASTLVGCWGSIFYLWNQPKQINKDVFINQFRKNYILPLIVKQLILDFNDKMIF
jgi:hypothetical protein